MSKDIPAWFAAILADESPIVPDKVQWDFSGKDICIPKNSEKEPSLPTGFVKCDSCKFGIPERYKVMVEYKGKMIHKKNSYGDFMYDFHCKEFDRRVTGWFTCHRSKVYSL